MSASAVRSPPSREWLSFGIAARRLGVSPGTVRELAEAGRFTVRRIPGAWPKVLTAEVDALAEASTRPAGCRAMPRNASSGGET